MHCARKIPHAKIIQEGTDQRTDLPFISWLCYQFEILFYVCQRLRRTFKNAMAETNGFTKTMGTTKSSQFYNGENSVPQKCDNEIL